MTTTYRVVLADDVADLRFLMTRALERSGRFRVVGTAANGREAINQALEHRPDVTLLDLAMPGMDGLEALPHIRRAVPECTVVVLSGFDAETMQSRAIEQGAAGYLVKGLNPMGLADQVLRMLRTISLGPDAGGGLAVEDQAEIELPAELISGRKARLFLSDRLAEWRLDGLMDTALLLTTELVTNAVIHAGSAVRVTVRRGLDNLRVEVADTGGGALHLREPGPDATTGRGLQLMEALATAWGTSAYEAGKLVWFELQSGTRPA
jgi:CheY-like chemotaxis protein